MDDCLSFQMDLFDNGPSAGLGFLSVYLLICLTVTECLFASVSVVFSVQTDLAHRLSSAT